MLSEREGEAGKRDGGKWTWRLPGIKVANPGGWRTKSHTDRTDGEKSPYLSQNGQGELRMPSDEDIKVAKEVGTLNQSLPASLHPGESATLVELKARRGAGSSHAPSVSETGSKPHPKDTWSLLARPPAWLRDQIEHCRKEGYPARQLKALSAALASEVYGDATRGGEVLATVEAFLTHGLGCECEECS